MVSHHLVKLLYATVTDSCSPFGEQSSNLVWSFFAATAPHIAKEFIQKTAQLSLS
jgi:hypothetical protein